MGATLVSPIVVGRERELAELDALAQSARSGESVVVLVGGEAGVGKSRLLAEAGSRMGDAGMLTLKGACLEIGGSAMPFAPLVDVLRSLAETMPRADLEEIAGPALSELARLVPELDSDGARAAGGAGSTAQLFELVLGVISRLSAERPLALAIEDLHWADGSTLELISLLVHSLRGMPAMLLVTFRSDEVHRTHPLRGLIAAWERSRSIRRLDLERLGRDAVAGQIAAISGAAAEPEVVDVIFERSEGNAFLVEELLDAVIAGADPRYLPPSLRDVLLARADRLSPEAQQVLRVASVSGAGVSDGLLAAVAEMERPAFETALREAVEHQLLLIDPSGRGYAFRHAMAREAVYADVLPGERMRLHVAYGEALSADPSLAGADAAAALGHHWFAAHDLPRALGASIDAARKAAASYAPEDALRELERALEIWPQVEDAEQRAAMTRSDLLLLAADAAYHSGRLERALALLDQGLQDADVDVGTRARLLTARGRVDRDLGRGLESVADIEQALTLLLEEPPGAARAGALALLSNALMRQDAMVPAAERAEQAIAIARATGAAAEERDAQITLGGAAVYLDELDRGVEALELGLELSVASGDHSSAVRACINLADAFEVAGRHHEAVEIARRGLEIASRVGLTRTAGGYLTGNLVESLVRAGRWSEADPIIEEVVGWGLTGTFGGAVLITRAELYVLRGDYVRAGEDLDVVRRLIGAGDPQDLQLLAFVEADCARARGEFGQARAIVERALHERSEGGMWARYGWRLIWVGMRTEAEHAARSTGGHDPARVTVLLALAGTLRLITPAARMHAALTRVERERLEYGQAEVETAAQAVAATRDAEEPHLLAYALLRLAEGSMQASDRDAALVALREADSIVSGLGAVPLAEAIDGLARRARLTLEDAAGASAPGTRSEDDLERLGVTSREREVLMLLVAGSSNGEIAQTLFISRKTASVHVSNLLAKLGVKSRVEAAALAHRLGVASESD
jgi:predicted ATPase/DNA-binding NarL/FixJ family response regulator